ncbi:MAG: sulfur carrier protein ThiS [Proteobacteria bacterium]|nr:sulfur carrier protein ThiS [Pseudomonadota bacterium]
MIDIWVNGEEKSVENNCNVQQVLKGLGVPEHIVIVERNLKIVPRDRYGDEPVEQGDKLELVRLMGGG